MATELAFALINPYTISKSRTGGVIGRLLTRTGLELVAARLFGPSQDTTPFHNGHYVTLRLTSAMLTPLAKRWLVYSSPRRSRPCTGSGRQALAKRQEPMDAPISVRCRGALGNHEPNSARSSP